MTNAARFAKMAAKPAPKKTMDVVGMIMDYETGQLDANDTIEMFSLLRKNGTLFGLQGHYHRMFNAMVEQGYLAPDGTIVSFFNPNA